MCHFCCTQDALVVYRLSSKEVDGWPSSYLERDCLLSDSPNNLSKGMNPTILRSAMKGRLGSLTLVWQENLWIQTSCKRGEVYSFPRHNIWLAPSQPNHVVVPGMMMTMMMMPAKLTHKKSDYNIWWGYSWLVSCVSCGLYNAKSFLYIK